MSFEGFHIVLVEDDATMGHSLVQRLELEGARVTWVKQMVRGISAIRTPHTPVDAVVCDIRLPDGTGEEIYETVARTASPPPFLFITGQGEIEQAVRLLRSGAADYLTKPFDISAFLQRLTNVISAVPRSGTYPNLTGISSAAVELDALVAEVADADRHVLIKGQRGLGKAQIARRVFEMSSRRAAGVHEVNAYENPDFVMTETATDDDGTFIILAVDHLSNEGQGSLLALLRGGASRVIASATDDIVASVEASGFREDLYFALLASEIVVPPLELRPEDAVWLAQQFFKTLNARRDEPFKGMTELSLEALREHDWPGNGREVRARVVRALGAARKDWIFPVDLFPELNDSIVEFETLAEVREAAERKQILKALERSGGQVNEAARALGVSRTTLWEKMQKFSL